MPSRKIMLGGIAFLTVMITSMSQVVVGAEPSFYSGKTVTLLIGTSPGGLGDLRYRTVANYLFKKYLPGIRSIVYKYMPGGGGVGAANFMATAKRDGLTIGASGAGIILNAIGNTPGVRYKLDDFIFLGAASSDQPFVLIIRPGLELDTVEKLRAYKGLRFAQRSVGHTLYVIDRVFAFILELREPRWILGYSNPEINIAIEAACRPGRYRSQWRRSALCSVLSLP